MKNWSGLFIIAIILIFGISLVFLIDKNEPEHYSVVSEDGIVSIEGSVRSNIDIEIEVQEVAGSESLPWPVYFITPEKAVLESPLTLIFDVSSLEQEDPDKAVVYRYDENLMMWQNSGVILERDTSKISVEIDKLGYYTLGHEFNFEILEQKLLIDEVLALAPEGTVGYEINVGFAPVDDVMIQVPGILYSGGCFGGVHGGDRIERSMKSYTAPILLNDSMMNVEISLIAEWFVCGVKLCELSDLESEN